MYVIEGIDSKVISVCLIIDYSLIADLYTFVYGSVECASISLRCRKIKLSNNFDLACFKYQNLKRYFIPFFCKNIEIWKKNYPLMPDIHIFEEL